MLVRGDTLPDIPLLPFLTQRAQMLGLPPLDTLIPALRAGDQDLKELGSLRTRPPEQEGADRDADRLTTPVHFWISGPTPQSFSHNL